MTIISFRIDIFTTNIVYEMILIFSIVFLFTELLFWLAITTQFGNNLTTNLIFAGLAIVTPICLTYFRNHFGKTVYDSYKIPFYTFGVLIVTGVPKLVISILTLIYLAIHSVFNWGGDRILLTIIWSIGAYLILALIYAIVWGRFNFKIRKEEISFNNLPQELDGMSFVQISDIHIGSFFDNHKPVAKAVDLINSLNPDYIFFTGDLVNNYAEEMKGWVPVLSKMKAKKGKFSILGNHDYGDYVKWGSSEEADLNLKRVIDYHKEIGFDTLLNRKVKLTEGDENAYLIGVENLGAPPFKQYGDIDLALKGSESTDFQILLSHDPSHFDLEVIQKTDIDLTLSGHTHGGQVGLDRWGMKWGFVKYKYKKWAGLYQEGKQFLYVNRGFGYIGFPGRLGVYPEITHITLRRSDSKS